MPIYSIRGYEVDFPHDAYPCQITYMEHVLAALEQSENALLESPTGTGKTLCLLCATLAWREAYMKKVAAPGAAESKALSLYEYQQQQAGIGAPADPAAAQHKGPTIIYSSRTHSQLAQVIKELRNTAYKVRTTVLGSRQQLCLHDKVSSLSGQAANFTCRALVAHKQCRWHVKHRQDKVVQELQSTVPAPVDIEELCKVGRHAEVCPYFLSRDLANTADLIFMPYNYLVDHQARSQISGVNWKDAVIIIDEAHNIQDVCNNNASFDLTGEQILNAIGELEQAQTVLKERISSGQTGEELTVYHQEGTTGNLQSGVTAENYAELLENLSCSVKIISALYQKLCDIETAAPAAGSGGGGGYGYSSSGAFDGGGVAQKGEHLLQILADLDITPDSYSNYLQQLLMNAVDVLSEHELASGRAMASKASVAAAGLSALISALDIVTASSLPLWQDPVRQTLGPAAHRGYRMFVHKSDSAYGGSSKGKRPRTGLMTVAGTPTLSYWCFIPGVSMASLRALPLRSVLLTSGTLSPLESFAHELQLGFKYMLENPHVINPNQVWVGVVPSGPTGANLNSSFANRNNEKYKDDLGHAIVNFARVVPDGLLVFFPAYSVLQSCLDHWKTSTGTVGGVTIWERIIKHKAPVIEPKASSSFAAAIADYQQKLEDPNGTGAVFFAVCRGKVSEGIDFSDKVGRGVVITGLPFPASHDPHVKLQKQLLDEEARAGHGGIMGGRGLTGEQWYVQQCLRAVNQAMGRVIRHRFDYGAVLLADERFGYTQNQRQLSKWLREHVVQHQSFGAAVASLTKFFKDKGDLMATAAAAEKAARLHNPSSGQQQWLSAFQLVGGSDGQPGAGSSTAAAAARAEQQRRLQLANVPRAIDVLGIVNKTADREQGGSVNSRDPGLDELLTDLQPAPSAAHNALVQQQQQGINSRNSSGGGSLGRLQPANRLQRSIVPRYEQESKAFNRSSDGVRQLVTAADDGNNVVGPARLVQQHKMKQQQQQREKSTEPEQQQLQQQQRSKAGSKQPLRMGQVLRAWNSTQVEQHKQQQQQQQQQQEDVCQDKAGGNGISQTAAAAAASNVPTDPKAFFKVLQEQLPAEQMTAVKSLLGAYRTTRDLTAFVDGLIAALGGSSSSNSSGSSRSLLAGFAAFMPQKDQAWFKNLVTAGGSSSSGRDAAAAAAAGVKDKCGSGSQAVGSLVHQQQQRSSTAVIGSKRSAAASASAHNTPAPTGGSDGVQSSSSRLNSNSKNKVTAGVIKSESSNALEVTASARTATKKAKTSNSGVQQQQQQQQGASTSQHPAAAAAASKPAGLVHKPVGQPAKPFPGQPPPAAAAAGSAAGAKSAGSKQLPPGSKSSRSNIPAAGKSCKPCIFCKKSPMAAGYKAGCGHMACYSCWVEKFSVNLRGVTCPVCMRVVRRQQLVQVPFA